MLQRVLTIALNTYRESLRARILLGLAAVALGVAFYSLVVGAFTLNDAPRVVSDLGAASMSLFSIAVTIVIGATSLHRELEQKTIFPILARPIERYEYIVGKFVGTLLTIWVFILADTGVLLMLCSLLGDQSAGLVGLVGLGLVAALGLLMWRSTWARTHGPIPWSVLMVVAGALLCASAPTERTLLLSSAALAMAEVAVIAAVATLFSSFSTPFLSSVFTIGVLFVGRNADSLAALPEQFFGPAIKTGGQYLAKVIPNLHIYVPARPILIGDAPDAPLATYLPTAGASALAWSVILLTAAALVFRRRDFL